MLNEGKQTSDNELDYAIDGLLSSGMRVGLRGRGEIGKRESAKRLMESWC